ncbi:MAG: hypothetical protein KGI37_05810 [Alphaproteobacteria bacterium]|nr:hypothetical protein [Alphaproteobacteria bacterium]
MAETKKGGEKKGDAKADSKKTKKSGKATAFLVTAVLVFAAPFMMPTLVLLLAGLVPTYVALITDNDPQKSGALSVGALNFAGIVPFIIGLWEKGQTMPNAFAILSDANDWAVILGAAAMGQLVVYAVPQAIATMTLTHAEIRTKALRKNLDMLRESWGPEVGTTKPVDKLVQE